MTLRLYLTTAVLALAAAFASAQTVTDDLGREVTLAAPPTAVVSLLPSHTETVCALGACELLVGIDRHSDVEGTDDLPTLGDPYAPDVEAIVALEPDLVLVDEYSGLHETLANLGLTVYAGSPQTVEETYAYIATIGTLLGRAAEADELVSRLQSEVAEVSAVLEGAERPTVFVEIDPTPFTAGPGSYIHELLVAAGGENVVPASLGQFPQVDPEFVVAADPQVILLLDAPFGVTAADVRARPGWDGIAAVRDDAVIALSEDATDALSRAGPRLAEAVRILAGLLHPDLF
ncbi:MAG TPA: ABC transporter substrate-binding protein [Trueperaceae bacterium]